MTVVNNQLQDAEREREYYLLDIWLNQIHGFPEGLAVENLSFYCAIEIWGEAKWAMMDVPQHLCWMALIPLLENIVLQMCARC